MPYVSVHIDASEVLDELSDDDLLSAVKHRSKQKLDDEWNTLRGEVMVAWQTLMRGDADEAQVILERLLFPKWRSPEDAENCLAKIRAS